MAHPGLGFLYPWAPQLGPSWPVSGHRRTFYLIVGTCLTNRRQRCRWNSKFTAAGEWPATTVLVRDIVLNLNLTQRRRQRACRARHYSNFISTKEITTRSTYFSPCGLFTARNTPRSATTHHAKQDPKQYVRETFIHSLDIMATFYPGLIDFRPTRHPTFKAHRYSTACPTSRPEDSSRKWLARLGWRYGSPPATSRKAHQSSENVCPW